MSVSMTAEHCWCEEMAVRGLNKLIIVHEESKRVDQMCIKN